MDDLEQKLDQRLETIKKELNAKLRRMKLDRKKRLGFGDIDHEELFNVFEDLDNMRRDFKERQAEMRKRKLALASERNALTRAREDRLAMALEQRDNDPDYISPENHQKMMDMINANASSYRQSPMQDEMARLEKENKALKEKLEGLKSPTLGVIDAITSLENKVKADDKLRATANYTVGSILGGFLVIAGLLEWIFG